MSLFGTWIRFGWSAKSFKNLCPSVVYVDPDRMGSTTPATDPMSFLRHRTVVPTQPRFVPLAHPEPYFRTRDLLGEDTTETRRLHAENPPEPPAVLKREKMPVPDDPHHVRVSLVVSKTGRVRLGFHTRMSALYEQMQRTHKLPTIEERVLAARDFGYPDEALKRMIDKHEKYEASRAELDQFIVDIFGELSDKKTSSPKKRTLTQVLKIKKQVYAMPDDPDELEENENEDAHVPEED